MTTLQSPTRPAVYSAMPTDRLRRSTLKGSAIFLLSALPYIGFFVLAAAGNYWWLQLVGSIGVGFQASVLFAIGHDACHGSLTANSKLNRLLATLSFFPSFHPYTSWKYTHNGLHHGWTNVRGKEIVYVPFSKAEFDGLPKWRQSAERFFRSVAGCGAFYFFTVYLPHEMFANRDRGPKGNAWRTFNIDRIQVFGFGVFLIVSTITLAVHSHRSVLFSMLCTTLFPGVVYFWLMSFVTFLHHTHPKAPWFNGEFDFNYFGILLATVHVEFPRPIEIILHEILQHTAHHADTRIPLYNLKSSQRALEVAYPSEVIHEPWSWRGFKQTLKTCRLYDYEQHRWLDYDGTPLSPPLLTHRESIR